MSKSWIINFYSLTKFLYPKNCCLYCLVFAQFSFVGLFLIVLCFLHLKIFLREINREKVVLIASIAILLIWTPLNPPMVFFTKLFYLHAPSFKCVNLLWSFVRISSFCCVNLFEPYLSVRISSYLWLSVRTSSYLWSSWGSFKTSFCFLVFMKLSKCMNTII